MRARPRAPAVRAPPLELPEDSTSHIACQALSGRATGIHHLRADYAWRGAEDLGECNLTSRGPQPCRPPMRSKVGSWTLCRWGRRLHRRLLDVFDGRLFVDAAQVGHGGVPHLAHELGRVFIADGEVRLSKAAAHLVARWPAIARPHGCVERNIVPVLQSEQCGFGSGAPQRDADPRSMARMLGHEGLRVALRLLEASRSGALGRGGC